ncbi:Exopolyphosphatase [invertebrate metagenome]|uniref:Exopolyphosphatase n=1 Tax=invertebrate metagenome TaxID=1711999 RepID=A0A2H9TBI9_9ZZZZ
MLRHEHSISQSILSMINNYHDETSSQKLMAAIDLGSNSFHLIVARRGQGEIRPLDRLGEKVQLAAGLDPDGYINDITLKNSMSCLARFAQYLKGGQFDGTRVVGTNALRKAKNSRDFIAQAEKILDCPVEIIAGREEARLIYLGVAHTCADDGAKRLVIDIGGGSTEFIIGKRFEPRLMESLHMGCVSYTQRFFPDNQLTPERFQAAYYAARLELINITRAYRRQGWVDTIGSSGSIRSISHTISQMESAGADTITHEGLERLKQKLLSFHSLTTIQLNGLKPDRQNIFPAGLAILTACFDALHIRNMQISDGALREGILYDMMGRSGHENVRERTITALMTRYHVDQEQSEKLRKHAMICFKQAKKSWKLSKEANRRLLCQAARLSEIGLDISHSKYNRHGAYLIRHSDLMGFSKQQQQQLALLILCHRRSIPLNKFKKWSSDEAQRLLKLAILLRLACLLNHCHSDEAMPTYKIQVEGTQITVIFPPDWISAHPLTQADFEREQHYLDNAGFSLSVY